MNARRILVSLLVAAGALAAPCQDTDAVVRDKVTQAVMKVYDDHLAENPNDYNVLFARAHQHYYDGDYTAALTDVNQAMMLTPKTDKELRFDEYILRARISDARKDYIGELADLKLAQELQPKSLPCTDMIAKANLKAGNLDAAEKAFKTILRAESMNYDAMYGLAQVEQARGNAKAAEAHVTKAVTLFRVEPQVYVNRADIFARQGNIRAAVEDLLAGMAVGNGGNAAQCLFELSDKDYDGVMRSLGELADVNATDGGMYRYLGANIAMDHCRYSQALAELERIQRGHLYSGAGVDYSIAKCCLELARFDEAADHAERAIARDALQPDYYVVKALAQYYAGEGGHADAAMETLQHCSRIAPQFVPMLLTKAMLLKSQGNDNEALGYLNAAVANEPDNADALMARALVLRRLGHDKLAVRDLNTIVLQSDDAYRMKGFALNELGRDNEAFAWLNQLTSSRQPGGEDLYYAALFMATRGDGYKAMEYMRQAIAGGFDSQYRLYHDVLSPLNFKAMRSEPGFDQLGVKP